MENTKLEIVWTAHNVLFCEHYVPFSLSISNSIWLVLSLRLLCESPLFDYVLLLMLVEQFMIVVVVVVLCFLLCSRRLSRPVNENRQPVNVNHELC